MRYPPDNATFHAIRRKRLGFCCFLNRQFTTIVAAGRAYGVVNVVCATVGAKSQCGHLCYIMGTTLGLPSVRLSSFRMCHIVFILLLLNVSLRALVFTCHAERPVRASPFALCCLLLRHCTQVILEKRSHVRVATTVLVTMHYRKIYNNQFVCQPRQVQSLYLPVPVPFAFLSGNGFIHRVQASVAGYLHGTVHTEVQVEILFTQLQHRVHQHISPQEFRLFYGTEVSIAQREFETMLADLQGLQTNTMCRQLVHSYTRSSRRAQAHLRNWRAKVVLFCESTKCFLQKKMSRRCIASGEKVGRGWEDNGRIKGRG